MTVETMVGPGGMPPQGAAVVVPEPRRPSPGEQVDPDGGSARREAWRLALAAWADHAGRAPAEATAPDPASGHQPVRLSRAPR